MFSGRIRKFKPRAEGQHKLYLGPFKKLRWAQLRPQGKSGELLPPPSFGDSNFRAPKKALKRSQQRNSRTPFDPDSTCWPPLNGGLELYGPAQTAFQKNFWAGADIHNPFHKQHVVSRRLYSPRGPLRGKKQKFVRTRSAARRETTPLLFCRSISFPPPGALP